MTQYLDTTHDLDWRSNSDTDHPITRKISRLLERHHPEHRLHLGGTPYVDLPDHIRDAAVESLALKGYTHSAGEPGLRNAIAESLRAADVPAEPERLVVTNGAMHAVDLCLRVLLRPGDEVLMPAPGFFIGGSVRRAGGRLVQFGSRFDEGFRPAWDLAQEKISPRTRVLFVNSPVNPTGYVFDETDRVAALELAERNHLTLISDESCFPFVYGGAQPRSLLASPLAAAPSMVLARSFSKDYAMPGMRVGYALLPENLMEPVLSTLEWSLLCVSRVAQAAALAALLGPQEWVQRMVDGASALGTKASAALNTIPGIDCLPARGGLNLFPRYTGDVDSLVEKLVIRAGIPVCPGDAFGLGSHFRIQFGGPRSDLKIALDRLKQMFVDPAA